MAMDCFAGKLAVVTGGGSGIGRELARQLAAQGCSVAACDVNPDSVAVAAATAWAAAPPGVAVTSHVCDVSDEAQVLRFRDELLGQHASDHVDLVFSNAGIGGGGSFVKDSREEWERTFAVDWWGVYYCARTFLPLLIASGDGILVNVSSLNGLWATLGPGMPNNAYSTAKFAVRGLQRSAHRGPAHQRTPVRVAVVLPGSVGTDIVANTRRAHGMPGPEARQRRADRGGQGLPGHGQAGSAGRAARGSARDHRTTGRAAKDRAQLSAAEAATIILDGVRSGAWRNPRRQGRSFRR